VSDERHADGEDAPLVLAELESGELDDRTLGALFDDVARDAELVAILVKGGAETLSEGMEPSLSDALALLRARRVRGVQLRYRYGGVEWWDTLIAAGERVRLLRSRAPTMGL
jgi:hypothetical protein